MNKPNSNLCLIVNLAPNMGLLSRKWKTILVSFFLLLLVPTIVVLSIILAKNKPLSTTSDLQKADSSKMYQDLYVRTNPHKVYLISVGEETGPLEYRDINGQIRGFNTDIINAVCKMARMNCEIVYTPYEMCWNSPRKDASSEYGGAGLLAREFDACCGWYHTRTRMLMFQFSLPYHKKPVTYIYHRSGDDIDGSSFVNKTIGFLTSWAQDPKCIEREYPVRPRLKNYKAKYYASAKDSVKALQKNEIDAIFGSYQLFRGFVNDGQIAVIHRHKYWCVTEGNSMMARKDSDFIARWNIGFQRLQTFGEFSEMCDEAYGKHGARGIISCVDT